MVLGNTVIVRRPLLTKLILASLLVFVAPAAALAKPLYFGFNDDWRVPTHTVPMTKRFGANAERVQVFWRDTERSPGVYDFYGLDRTYDVMVAHGTPPLLDIVTAPAWARDASCDDDTRCPESPAHDGDYARFAAILAQRYPQAIGIELSNEPNLHNWWLHPDPARYAQMVKAAAPAIKQANPNMRVILGSTCCNTAHGNGDIGASTYLSELYGYGIKGLYDAIGFHIYPGRSVKLTAPDIQSEVSGMLAVRNANGDNAPLWITETGFPSSGYSPYGGGHYTPKNQAPRIAITYRILEGMPDIQALLFYRLTDPAPGETEGISKGIYYHDMKPKPAVKALLSAIKAPPFPQYTMHAYGPAFARPGRPILVHASGYNGHGKKVRYQWVVLHNGTWWYAHATTHGPSAHIRVYTAGSYQLGVILITPFDQYLGTGGPLQVGHQSGA